ncbi:MAG TPA: NAD(P)-binding protein [Chloroflexota bacterium]|nr:NAD(P)-binding protein [Chloroflexota bacterium]
MPEYDAVVAGAGIAGWTAGLRAAQLGAKVLLIDKAAGPSLTWAFTDLPHNHTYLAMRSRSAMLGAITVSLSKRRVPPSPTFASVKRCNFSSDATRRRPTSAPRSLSGPTMPRRSMA